MKEFCKSCIHNGETGDYNCPLPRQQTVQRGARIATAAMLDSTMFFAFGLVSAGARQYLGPIDTYTRTKAEVQDLIRAREAIRDCIVTRQLEGLLEEPAAPDK